MKSDRRAGAIEHFRRVPVAARAWRLEEMAAGAVDTTVACPDSHNSLAVPPSFPFPESDSSFPIRQHSAPSVQDAVVGVHTLSAEKEISIEGLLRERSDTRKSFPAFRSCSEMNRSVSKSPGRSKLSTIWASRFVRQGSSKPVPGRLPIQTRSPSIPGPPPRRPLTPLPFASAPQPPSRSTAVRL